MFLILSVWITCWVAWVFHREYCKNPRSIMTMCMGAVLGVDVLAVISILEAFQNPPV